MPVREPDLLEVLGALSNPHRFRVLAALHGGRCYVSQLARELEISRPLLQVHLKKLEQAGLVRSAMELSEDGKALNYYEVTEFDIRLTPTTLARAARDLHDDPPRRRKAHDR